MWGLKTRCAQGATRVAPRAGWTTTDHLDHSFLHVLSRENGMIQLKPIGTLQKNQKTISQTKGYIFLYLEHSHIGHNANRAIFNAEIFIFSTD